MSHRDNAEANLAALETIHAQIVEAAGPDGPGIDEFTLNANLEMTKVRCLVTIAQAILSIKEDQS